MLKKNPFELYAKHGESKVLKWTPQGILEHFPLYANKPVPVAKHGTVCLQGKQRYNS